MTLPTEDSPWNPTWKPLGPEQRRVLGVLIEKAKTTPAGYPMTVNAITTGCNQKSNRDPVMTLRDDDVEMVLGELQQLGVVVEAPEATRSVKYRHKAYEWLGVERAELAVMTELLLRGAQTLGDLRGRAARMEKIGDMAELKPIVDGLVRRRLMIELTPPGRGQIVSHNLYTEPELAALKAQFAGGGYTPPPRSDAAPAYASRAAADETVTRLTGELEELRAEVAALTERVATLEARDRDTAQSS